MIKRSDKDVVNENDVEFIRQMIKEYRAFGDLHNPDFEDTEKIYKALGNILAEREQDKKRIQELEEKNRKLKAQHIFTRNNTTNEEKAEIFDVIDKTVDIFLEREKLGDSIPKQKVKDILQNNRNELFSTTYLSKEQYRPYEMQIERINKIEQELLEGEK